MTFVSRFLVAFVTEMTLVRGFLVASVTFVGGFFVAFVVFVADVTDVGFVALVVFVVVVKVLVGVASWDVMVFGFHFCRFRFFFVVMMPMMVFVNLKSK